jgi:hypothetical protein
MNGPDMDEISLVTALRPAPPADAEQIRQRARSRLEVALTGAGPHRRARLSRNRRWVVLGAAAAAAAIAAVIAVPAALPGGGGSIVTKAWAVTRSPDGATVTVTIKQTLSDQAGLQRALRADGVPAYVRPMSRCGEWLPVGGLEEIRTNDWKRCCSRLPETRTTTSQRSSSTLRRCRKAGRSSSAGARSHTAACGCRRSSCATTSRWYASGPPPAAVPRRVTGNPQRRPVTTARCSGGWPIVRRLPVQGVDLGYCAR